MRRPIVVPPIQAVCCSAEGGSLVARATSLRPVQPLLPQSDGGQVAAGASVGCCRRSAAVPGAGAGAPQGLRLSDAVTGDRTGAAHGTQYHCKRQEKMAAGPEAWHQLPPAVSDVCDANKARDQQRMLTASGLVSGGRRLRAVLQTVTTSYNEVGPLVRRRARSRLGSRAWVDTFE